MRYRRSVMEPVAVSGDTAYTHDLRMHWTGVATHFASFILIPRLCSLPDCMTAPNLGPATISQPPVGYVGRISCRARGTLLRLRRFQLQMVRRQTGVRRPRRRQRTPSQARRRRTGPAVPARAT